MGFVANFIRFPAVQKFWKSVKSWQSYRQFKGGNFFLRHSVLLVLWMMSHNGSYRTCRDSIYMSAMLEQVVNFQHIQQAMPHCLTMSSYTAAANCTSWC